MKLRHLSLVFSFAALVYACQKSVSSLQFSYASNKSSPLAQAAADGNWQKVEELSAQDRDPLLQLLHQRALFELKRFTDVQSAPAISDPRFASYDIFLRSLSAYEDSKFDLLTSFQIPTDLPRPLQERLWMIHGEGLQEIKKFDQAEAIFETFLKDFKRSSFRGDVLIRLADIALSLGKNEKAESYYEELYEFFPITDSDDLARQRLIDAGRFAQIDTDTHLTRIQQLRKASHFDRAHREVKNLLKTATKDQRPRLELALAQINFGERNYRESEKLARAALKGKISDALEIEWRQILATSLIRLGKSDKGESEYQKLLDKKIPPPTRERILFRLGLTALDRLDYETAAFFFSKVRSLFPSGVYVESAHWFGALAIYFAERERPEADGSRISDAIKLLDRLMDLPHGPTFAPQAVYWKSILYGLVGKSEDAKEAHEKLIRDWPLSFHTRLAQNDSFRFFKSREFSPPRDQPLLTPDDTSLSIKNHLSWKRLEIFRSVNLKTWGAMELEQFLDANQAGDDKLNIAVAERLESVEDWANLVRWADKNLSRTIKDLKASDPVLRFHYPRAYEQEVLKQAENYQISPFLIWGIMREESRYRSDVISAAGAVGLMQVMPSLGKRIGGLVGEAPNKRTNLTDPIRNIRYGSFHLNELKASVDKLPVSEEIRQILQIAAYNAGIEAVGRWIKEKDFGRPDVFVESIPFQETRQYVKRVLQTAYIYSELYGRDRTIEVPRTREPEAGKEQGLEKL